MELCKLKPKNNVKRDSRCKKDGAEVNNLCNYNLFYDIAPAHCEKNGHLVLVAYITHSIVYTLLHKLC